MLAPRENSEIGGGPAGGAGQVHADPHSEFGAAEHTHTMSPLEIGIMVGVIVVFATVIGSLFFYRARKIKKTQADAEAGSRPGTKDGVEVEDTEVVKNAAEVPSGSFRQLFGRRWFSPKNGKFSPGVELRSHRSLLMGSFVVGSKVDDVPLERV